MIGIAAGLASEGKIPFCATFTLLRHPAGVRPGHDQRRLCQHQREDRRHRAGHHRRAQRRHAHVLPGPGHHAGHAQHARLQPVRRLRAALGACATWRPPTARPTCSSSGRSSRQVFDAELRVRSRQGRRASRDGSDVTLVSTGYMTHSPCRRPTSWPRQGVSVDLLHYPCVKPFDAETLVASAEKTGGVVTVENQSIIGGLGGAVCEVLSEQCPTPVKRLGVPDRFGEVATEDYLFDKHGFGRRTSRRPAGDWRRRTPSRRSTPMKIAVGSVVKGFRLKEAVKSTCRPAATRFLMSALRHRAVLQVSLRGPAANRQAAPRPRSTGAGGS